MVGSIGAVGATVNLSGLLEVEVLQYIAAQHNYNHTIALSQDLFTEAGGAACHPHIW